MSSSTVFKAENEFPSYFVDSTHEIMKLVDALSNLPTNPPSLYIDLEGVSLSRHGTISIMQIYIAPLNCVFLLDIHILGSKAFTQRGSHHKTLKAILEDEAVPKVFFDVRNDSEGLSYHFQISLAGVQDLQLMEAVARVYSSSFVSELAKCLDRDISLSGAGRKGIAQTKERGLNLFAPERGGSYEVFQKRPLSEAIRLYCIQDVRYMPALWKEYSRRMTGQQRTKVKLASIDRVRMSQSKGYNSNGRSKAYLPLRW